MGEAGPCDVNGIFGGYQGPGPKTVLALQSRREAELPARPRSGPQTGRPAVQGPRRQGDSTRSDRRGDRAPRSPGCFGRRGQPGGPSSEPGHRSRFRHPSGLHERRRLDPGRRPAQGEPRRRHPFCSAGARTTTTSTAPMKSSAWPEATTEGSRPAPTSWRNWRKRKSRRQEPTDGHRDLSIDTDTDVFDGDCNNPGSDRDTAGALALVSTLSLYRISYDLYERIVELGLLGPNDKVVLPWRLVGESDVQRSLTHRSAVLRGLEALQNRHPGRLAHPT